MKENVRKLLAMRALGFGIGDLAPIVLVFLLVAVIGAVTLLILANFGGSTGNTCVSSLNGNYINAQGLCQSTVGTANIMPTVFTASYNGLAQGVSGINQIMTFLPLLALVVVAAVIIGVVIGAFVLGGRKQEGGF